MANLPSLLEISIAAGTAGIVAVGIKLWRARHAGRSAPLSALDALMKRAEAHAEESPFLRTVSRQYKTGGHISKRQIDSVTRALARLEDRKA